MCKCIQMITRLFLALFLLFEFIQINATRQLSFSGGGAFGAVEIGILKKIRETDHVPYDRYTGISAGGLNAGFLSHFSNINDGIITAENLYSTIHNRDVYEALPETGVSLLNTHPLHKTLTNIVANMTSPPKIDTLIGTVNLNTGNLDIYEYNKQQTIEDSVSLLMSTSAIPVAFPPIKYNGYMYADGGTLSNELLDVVHSGDYLEITYITPYDLMSKNMAPITSIKEMVVRTLRIVKHNFNNPFTRLNHECAVPYGEINYYYVDPAALAGYNMLNFDKGSELIGIGYNHAKKHKYVLC